MRQLNLAHLAILVYNQLLTQTQSLTLRRTENEYRPNSSTAAGKLPRVSCHTGKMSQTLVLYSLV